MFDFEICKVLQINTLCNLIHKAAKIPNALSCYIKLRYAWLGIV